MPHAPWRAAIAQRATAGFVTDPSYGTYSLGEAYPTTRSPASGPAVTFGWSVDRTANSRNRDATADPRVAGMNFTNNTAHYFRVDFPVPGTYFIHVGCGDAQGTNPAFWNFNDGAGSTLIAITAPSATNAMADSRNMQFRVFDWDENEKGINITFTSDHLRVQCASATGNQCLAFVDIQQVEVTSPQAIAYSADLTLKMAGNLGGLAKITGAHLSRESRELAVARRRHGGARLLRAA